MKQLKESNKKINHLYLNKKMVLLLCLLLIIFGVGFYQSKINKDNKSLNEPYLLSVQEGDTLGGVIDRLKEDNVIANPSFAKLHAKMSNQSQVFVGTYEISPNASIVEIIELISKPSIMDVSVTLTEGMWAKDMALAIENKTGISKDKLLKLWSDEKFIKNLIEKYEVLTKDIINKDVKVLLEGYLYPDTYQFRYDSSPEEITYQILDNTEHKYLEVKDLIKKSKRSIHEVVTLSSVVMFEASEPSDQRMVAGVFENRLKIDMPLQSSVTVCYVLYEFEDWEECELYENQLIESPYNTYLNEGLPIGPITNPDIKAIQNTLNYKKHDYFYFVADVYEGGDGTVYYSKTYAEHEKKVEELRNR